MRVLVTGCTSFTARHLLPALRAHDGVAEIAGTDLAADGPKGTPYRRADLTREEEAASVVAEFRPDRIVHLAGIRTPDPDASFAVNLEATRNLLRAAMARETPPGILFVSSAAVYGHTRPGESPVTEETPLRPASFYGASKAAAELSLLASHRIGRAPAVAVRPFNLIGPGLPPGLAASDFLARARDVARGTSEPEIRTGNLAPRRDFVDVRDAAAAYVSLVVAGAELWGRAYNVCTGRPTAIGDLLAGILAATGVEATVTADPALVRPAEVPEQVGSFAALRDATGWTPGVSLERSLRDMAAGEER